MYKPWDKNRILVRFLTTCIEVSLGENAAYKTTGELPRSAAQLWIPGALLFPPSLALSVPIAADLLIPVALVMNFF